MTCADVLAYMKQAGREVTFRQIANYFPGEWDEILLISRLRWMCAHGWIRQNGYGKFEVVE